MIIGAIVVAEVAFWAFLVGGLAARYFLRAPRVGAAFLIATPFVDLALLILTYIDLSSGSDSNFAHGLSAIYIGFSVVFGPSAVRAMDAKFARRYQNVHTSETDTSSVDEQRRIWLRCCVASGISGALLLAGIAVVGLAGAFWLIYWLVVVVSIVIVWWFIGPGLARRRAKRRASRTDVDDRADDAAGRKGTGREAQ